VHIPIASVVVPAHNEEAVLERTLQWLLAGTAPGELDVVVVANACTDRTAEVARRASVRVLESPVPGKVRALLLGDAACRAFPRVYLDADVELTGDSVRALVAALDRPGVLACAPLPELDLTGASWLIRRVHLVHEQLVGPDRGLAGAGAYVLSERGHARVFPLPEVVSDDGWVHSAFTPAERVVVGQARSVVRPALTGAAYLRRRVRVRVGNRQLTELGRPLAPGRRRLRTLGRLIARRLVSPLDVACYLAVLATERVVTRVRRSGGEVSWATDTSSRHRAGHHDPR
jgi:glycosyltransferase involved in cell wall biosynthesis